MQSILLTIERKNFIKHERFIVHISFNSEDGLVIKFPGQNNSESKKKLENKIRECISLDNYYIKTQYIAERTFIVGRIVKDLRDQIFNGYGAVTDIAILTQDK